MNIFDLNEEEFDKKLDEILENITPDELMKELIECGLEIKEEYKNGIRKKNETI